MKIWPISLGAGLLTGLILFARRASASTSNQEPEPVMYGESKIVRLNVPPGWRRVTSAEVAAVPDLRSYATSLRSSPGFSTMPYGTLAPFTASDGNVYATWIEQHYHEPEGPIRPWGYHHGVTLLAKI